MSALPGLIALVNFPGITRTKVNHLPQHFGIMCTVDVGGGKPMMRGIGPVFRTFTKVVDDPSPNPGIRYD